MSAFTLNCTLQDILGATLAFCLFPIVIVFPGYVTGWALNLFDFRLRQPIVGLGIGLVLSFAVTPIVLDLTSSLLPFHASLIILGGFAAAFAVIILKEKTLSAPDTKRGAKIILWIGAAWVALAILSLIDFQWKDQLYFSVVSIDQATRVSIIDAMTRTGVPPINPSYYPGHPVQLTFLYYFWYILGSMIDVIGGRYVDARAALNASSAWSGLGLIAVVALYIRQRNTNNTTSAWWSAKIGVLLLTVSGLDVLPIAIIMAAIRNIVSIIEHWNTMIGAWIGSNLWAPHHIAALIAGLCAIMLAHSAREKTASRQFTILAIAGLGFASAVGLSVWGTLVFVAFWGVWLVALFLQKSERRLIAPMVFAGIVGILLASPFLIGIFQSGSGTAGQFPIMFEIRTLVLLEFFVEKWSPLARSLIMLAVLPTNYLLELGFFFIAGIYWLKIRGKEAIHNPFYLAEIILLAVVLFIGSCLRSTAILANDLGWRSWLPGQFVLLIWGVDILENMVFTANPITTKNTKVIINKNTLLILASIGILTSTLDVVCLRLGSPVILGEEVGKRSYSAHLAYDYLRDYIPAEVITQNNPLGDAADRSSGLYGTHQMVVSNRTVYGIPADDFQKIENEVKVLFTDENVTNWQMTDKLCQQYSIDVLIFKGTDPIWGSLTILKTQRPALYENAHYALFACGDYTNIH